MSIDHHRIQDTEMDDGRTVIALVKGEERYVFIFDDGNLAEALRTFGRFACNPELSFSWYDAAVLAKRVRSMSND